MNIVLILLVMALALFLIFVAYRLERTRDEWGEWNRALEIKIQALRNSVQEHEAQISLLQKNLDVTALVVEQDHTFIENVKATAKESTRASAARIAALQNRNLR